MAQYEDMHLQMCTIVTPLHKCAVGGCWEVEDASLLEDTTLVNGELQQWDQTNGCLILGCVQISNSLREVVSMGQMKNLTSPLNLLPMEMRAMDISHFYPEEWG